MSTLRIGLLSKKRGNVVLQERFAGAGRVIDLTETEVRHHERALREAGYRVRRIEWGPSFITDLRAAPVDLVFNVSSMVEAAILEELDIPYAGSDTYTIAIAADKSLAKRLWRLAGLPTSAFHVARSEEDCRIFEANPPIGFPLFLKPVAGRGSVGVDASSIACDYQQLVSGVNGRLATIGQPVLIEKFLPGREITVGILGNGPAARALPPLEIVFRDEYQLLTFERKMARDDDFLCPAPLSADATRMVQDLALRAYEVLGFRDYGRIDMKLTDEGPFLLEGNTFAGLMCTPREKPQSWLGFMARAEGMERRDLLDVVMQAAVWRLRDRHPAGGFYSTVGWAVPSVRSMAVGPFGD